LKETVRRNDSLVCVGLDPDLAKLPECVKSSATALFDFNKAIIDATKDYVCCYKPQAAYYAGQDRDDELKKTIEWQQRRIDQLEEEKRQLLSRDDAILAAFREEAKRAADHLLSEIEYLRQENVRKSKIVDKYFSTT
jgi:hypothetical protein